ncbi:MAG: hypothetical protein R6U50_08940 [Desulfobacterales bacterium]
MLWIDLVLIIFLAFILSGIVSWGLGWRHPAKTEAIGASFLFLFLILVLSLWAAGLWITPRGPVIYDTPWLELLIIGVFIALIILAVSYPTRRARRLTESDLEVQEAREEDVVASAFSVFFWILIVGLLIVALLALFAGV